MARFRSNAGRVRPEVGDVRPKSGRIDRIEVRFDQISKQDRPELGCARQELAIGFGEKSDSFAWFEL